MPCKTHCIVLAVAFNSEIYMPLKTETNLVAPDEFYEALIDTHKDLSNEQSQELNAALVLLLANHIGDMTLIREALQQARASVCEASIPPLA